MPSSITSYARYLSVLLLFLFLFMISVAQSSRMTGRVISQEDNKPLAGVSVQLKGKQTGTTTDEAGFFSIAAAPGDTLVISYVGYESAELAFSNAADITVPLHPVAAAMQWWGMGLKGEKT